MGRAGLWTLLAAALDEGDIVVVADLDQFDAMNDEAYESGLFIQACAGLEIYVLQQHCCRVVGYFCIMRIKPFQKIGIGQLLKLRPVLKMLLSKTVRHPRKQSWNGCKLNKLPDYV